MVSMKSPDKVKRTKEELAAIRRENGKLGGRPKSKSTLLGIKIRERIAELVSKNIDPIVFAMIDSAKGIQTEQYDRKKDELWYKDEGPNHNAARLLIEHAAGRPTDSVELTGKDGAELKHTVIYIPKPYESSE